MKRFIVLLVIVFLLVPAVYADGESTISSTRGEDAVSRGVTDKGHNSFYSDDESFNTNLFTGANTYSIPIRVPPGTSGLQPNLKLSYNSLATGSYGGQTGGGWQLTQNYVQRDIETTTDNISDDSFDLVLNGANYHLVYNNSDNRYHTKTESYINVTKHTNSPINSLGKYWNVTTPDGTRYRFGYQNASENLAFNKSYVLTWSLDLIEDVHGNKIYYNYVEDPNLDDYGSVYLENITYNNDKLRLVDFTYDTSNRPDTTSSYSQGSLVQNSRRLKEISAYFDGSLVRKYILNYQGYPFSGMSLLSSVVQIGEDGVSSLPATSFEYQEDPLSFVDGSMSISNIPMFERDGSGVNQTLGVVLSDVNGDGLVDVFQSYYENASGNYKNIFLNNRDGWTDVSNNWSRDNIPFFFEKDSFGGRDLGVRLLDVNFDGFADILQSYKNSSGNHRLLLLNNRNGTGWNSNSGWDIDNLPEFSELGASGTFDKGVRFLDANGDGLVDILQSYDSTKSLYLNNGSGWYETSNWDVSNIKAFSTPEGSGSKDMGVRVVDANGDGLPDIVESYDDGSTVSKSFFLNTGGNWTNFSSGFDLSGVPAFVKRISGISYDQGFFFVDLNNDGLVDLLQSFKDGGTVTKKAFINNGRGWEEASMDLSSVPTIVRKGEGLRGIRLVDLDGDGLSDIDRKSTRLNSSHIPLSRMPSSA